MTVQQLTRRIEKLEQVVAELADSRRRTGAWYVEHAGRFKNDPVYDEIVRRGQAYRRSLRPSSSANGRKRVRESRTGGGKR